MPEYLINSLSEVRSRLRDKDLSLFLDYDGTLAPITGRPEDARLAFPMRDILRSLAGVFPVAIISGRSLADITSLVEIDGLAYAGNHGLEAAAPDFTMTYDIGRGVREELDSLRRSFAALAERFKGVLLEDKGVTLTLHYRLLGSRYFEPFKEAFDEAAAGALARGRVRLGLSKKAFEIRANVDWDKGRAVEWMLERKMFSGTLPLYIGDDETDRDAYRAIGDSGICAHVGRGVEEAGYYLAAQPEVKGFLKWLLDPSSAVRRWYGC